MSGLWIGEADESAARGAAAGLSFSDRTTVTVGRAAGLAWAVTRVDSAELWGPASDSGTGVIALIGGRPTLAEPAFARAESMPFEGGLAARVFLDQWLRAPEGLAAALDGPALVAIIDARAGALHVFTDRLGWFPLYAGPGPGVVVASHPDVLADSLAGMGRGPEPDMLTLAEALGTSYSVHPHTRYRGVVQLDPATHYTFRTGAAAQAPRADCFWTPHYRADRPGADSNGLVDELADALTHAVRLRTNRRLGPAAVLLSGGADSRAMLFGAEFPESVTCFTLFDQPNAELDTARALAAAAGARHEALQRAPDYYAEHAERAVRISAGMWSIVDAHYTGVVDRLAHPRFGSVLTGCYADYLLKGLSFNRRHRLLFGRALPVYEFAPFSPAYYHAHAVLREPWQRGVDARLSERYPQALRERYPASALELESLRLRPLSREADASGRSILWATTPWAPVFADQIFLDVYQRIPAADKLNGILFGKSVARMTGDRARGIANSNFGTPVGASERVRIAAFLVAVGRRKLRRLGGLEPSRSAYEAQTHTTGSWPNWRAYLAASPMIARLWEAPSAAERELFADLLGQDPWRSSVQAWAAQSPLLFARILTSRLWLRQRGLV